MWMNLRWVVHWHPLCSVFLYRIITAVSIIDSSCGCSIVGSSATPDCLSKTDQTAISHGLLIV